MKTKNEILATVEIVIVLCSVFLVAIPTIAAGGTEEEYEPGWPLGVYGNANEDDTIDMGDVVYTKLAIFGKKPKTELCDAKYDGRINVLDVIQTKLIILGKEKELTVVDSDDRIVTIKKPINRFIPLSHHSAQAVRMIRATDKVVCIDKYTKEKEVFYPELSKLPSAGSMYRPDYEVILSLNPDLVISVSLDTATKADEKLPDSIAVISLHFYDTETMKEDVMKLGYILGKRDEAKRYIDDFNDKYIGLIKARTEGLSEEERPKVYVEHLKAYKTYGGKSWVQQIFDLVGGRNIFVDLSPYPPAVDPEAIVMRNPDIIIKNVMMGYGGIEKDYYEADDPSKMIAKRDELMNRPELASITAVKNGKVYVMYSRLYGGPGYPVGAAYWAKWFYPDLFKDLDPLAIHQEYIDSFCPGFDFDVSRHGVFVYHPEEHPDGR